VEASRVETAPGMTVAFPSGKRLLVPFQFLSQGQDATTAIGKLPVGTRWAKGTNDLNPRKRSAGTHGDLDVAHSQRAFAVVMVLFIRGKWWKMGLLSGTSCLFH
jgi:hypothetical protein